MTNLIKILFIFFGSMVLAQPETEVFIMDITTTETGVTIENISNVSNRIGYDNQPSFYDNNTLIYAGTRDGATDIVAMDIASSEDYWMNGATEGGEYSPVKIPNSDNVSAVRLDPDGLQRLYRYEVPKKTSILLIEDLQVAYYAYANEHTFLASVLSDDKLDLVFVDFQKKKIDTLLEGSGRSIHRIPGKEAMSYTATNEEGNLDVFQLDLVDKESYFVCQLPIGIQDYIWLDDSKLLLGSGSQLFLYDLFGNGDWKKVADLSEAKLKDISRLALSPDGTKLALAATSTAPPVDETVQSHIEPFNKRDLEAFAAVFTDDVVVSRFPTEEMYTGKAAFKTNYSAFYAKTPEVHVEVTNRIVFGNTVIDEEKVTIGKRIKRQATMYEVQNGKIKSMTFIGNQKVSESPEGIVQQQLDAYNNRDIDGFMATYASELRLMLYPETLIYDKRSMMRGSYSQFFEYTPDLHAEIKNRIVIGNKVIDEEYVTMNGENFTAIAIYEVENGLISKVTFIR